MADVMVLLDRGVPDRAVHPLDLAIRPRTAWLVQTTRDLGLFAGPAVSGAPSDCGGERATELIVQVSRDGFDFLFA